ncbi:MAG: flavin reductase family protein [Clostridia bacterium]|nr:flavin reductase family protein [Clostridia bacterium]
MSKTTWEGAALLAPVPPALVSCGTLESPNVLTAAWTGIICSKPPRTYVSIRPERFSHGIIEQTREFVINLPSASLVRETDLCGVKSGRDTDKFKLCNFTAEEGVKVNAPSIAECPISLECKVFDIIRLGSHDMFLADIAAVRVDGQYLDRTGRLMIERCKLLSYAHGSYFAPGEALGTFGFSVRKKPSTKKRPTAKRQPTAKNQKSK